MTEMNVGVLGVLWKKIRGLNLPAKIGLFLWKAIHGILPVKLVLARKGLVSEMSRPVCADGEETV